MTQTATKETGAQLIQQRREIDALIHEAEGDLSPELEVMLADVTVRIEDKIEATARFALSQKHSAAVIAEEIARLTERRAAYLHRAGHATDVRLRALLDTLGKDRVETPLVTVALQESPPSLVVDPAVWTPEHISKLPFKFVRHKPEEWHLDKEAVKREYKGKDLPEGMTLATSTTVRIR